MRISPRSPREILLLALFAAGLRPVAHAGPVIADITTDKARYNPGATITITVALANRTERTITAGTVSLRCLHLSSLLSGPSPQRFQLAAGATRALTFAWTAPTLNYQGYRVTALARDGNGQTLDHLSTAVDVSSQWTRFPRYGYLSGFPAQPRETSQTAVQELANYHINGLQFYDWQWKHHRPLAGTPTSPSTTWNDIANRTTYRQTVLDSIAAAHSVGMSAMNYNLLYGAWSDYTRDGVDARWALRKNPRDPVGDNLPMPGGWATPAIYLMNPGNPDWQNYLVQQEADVFAAYPFDGWHVDQVGERGPEFDAMGNPVIVWQTFRPFLNNAKSKLSKTIVFNNVGGYGLYDTAANSTEDAVYVECWEPAQSTYNDLKTVIEQCTSWSGGKGVILAAYLNKSYGDKFTASNPGSFNLPGVLLADATIFASGGSHIELGDGDHMLDSEYFPNHNLAPSPTLRTAVRSYYDFLVAYENLLRDGCVPTNNNIVLSGVASSIDASPNTVWTFARITGTHQVLHLINFCGEISNSWRDTNATYPLPTPKTDIRVKYYYSTGKVRSVNWASPDIDNGTSHSLPFVLKSDQGGNYVAFTVPNLQIWDMIYLTIL